VNLAAHLLADAAARRLVLAQQAEAVGAGHGCPVQNSSGKGASKSVAASIAPGCSPGTRPACSGSSVRHNHVGPGCGESEQLGEPSRHLLHFDLNRRHGAPRLVAPGPGGVYFVTRGEEG
jgi:hypothetical protein